MRKCRRLLLAHLCYIQDQSNSFQNTPHFPGNLTPNLVMQEIMEESRILVLKRANDEEVMSGDASDMAIVKSSSPTRDPSQGKENSPPRLVKGLSRVREAALALERLADAEKEQDRGPVKKWVRSEPKPKSGQGALDGLGRQSSLVQQTAAAPDTSAQSGKASTEEGQLGSREESRAGTDPQNAAALVGSGGHTNVPSEEDPQAEATSTNSPRNVAQEVEAVPWAVSRLRPARSSSNEAGRGVFSSALIAPAPEKPPMVGKGEEGERVSVRSLMQMWNRKEVSKRGMLLSCWKIGSHRKLLSGWWFQRQLELCNDWG
jgi:hypothetical protein